MEIQCPECGGRNVFDETTYQPGSSIEVPCRRCGSFIAVTVPGKPKADTNVPKAVQKAKGSDIELPARQNHAVQKTESPTPATSPQSASASESDEIKKAQMVLEAERIKLEHRKLDLEQQRAKAAAESYNAPVSSKSKTTAGLLGILLGGFGAHKFYLGKTGMGVLYLLFCWTYIPGIIGLIEGITYLTKSDAQWAAEHP